MKTDPPEYANLFDVWRRAWVCAATLTGLLGASITWASAAKPGAVPAEPLYALPTRLDRIGRVLAPVMINDRGPFRFIVDTGASRSALSPRLAHLLGLEPAPGDMLMLRGVTGSSAVASVRVASLRAGDVVMSDLQLPLVTPAVVADAEGFLGVDGFAGKRLLVDFISDKITIAKSTGRAPSSRFTIVPLQFRFGGLALADARIRGVKVKAVIDTGASRTLGNLALRKALGGSTAASSNDALRSTEIFGATEQIQLGNIRRSPPITLGGVELRNMEVTYADLEVFRTWNLENVPALLIGMDLLGTLREMAIDYRRREFQLIP